MKATPILDLNAEDAFNLLYSNRQYVNSELPLYFNFDPILEYVRKVVGNMALEDCLAAEASEEVNANLDILVNKDGKYAVRPLSIVNPYLYYFLCRELCSPHNWEQLRKCFGKFSFAHFSACAMPLVPDDKEAFPKSTTILNWWKCMEQKSIELSLEYKYMFVTDITNCYGSVDLRTVEWALNRKNTACQTGENTGLAERLTTILKRLQQGRIIGMPQGSVAFDFIAELILGYADLLLYGEIEQMRLADEANGICFYPYEVIRYRDDYRIFCNSKSQLEKISYALQRVLEKLNFRLNSDKTKMSDNIVIDAVKPDKLAYLANTPVFKKDQVAFTTVQKYLQFILMFARQHHNCGMLKTLLADLDRRIEYRIKQKAKSGTSDDEQQKEQPAGEVIALGGTVRAIAAIATQIAMENTLSCHFALRIISRLVCAVKSTQERSEIVRLVFEKLFHLPNSSYVEIWLQHITYQRDKKLGESPYTMPLCRLAAGENVRLWDNSWLKPALVAALPYNKVCDYKMMRDMTPVIKFSQRMGYDTYDEFIDLADDIDEVEEGYF